MMNYKELIDALRNFTYWCGSSQNYAHGIHPKILDDVADAIEDLTEENERLKVERNILYHCKTRGPTCEIIPTNNILTFCGIEVGEAMKRVLEYTELTSDRARLQAELDAAIEDIELLADSLNPCCVCDGNENCVHPASCPETKYKNFKWRGAKGENDGRA